MSHNPVENYFLHEAIKRLKPLYEAIYGVHEGQFDVSRGGPRFMILNEGTDKGKLTVATNIDGMLHPDPKIIPVDCYNLMGPNESVSEAMARVLSNR